MAEARWSIPRIKGTRDLLGEELAQIQGIKEVLDRCLSSYGYHPIEVPIIESSELYLRKSGGQVASQMYAFTDQGGHRLSLRPEFTASIIRAFIQRGPDLPIPVRWQYCGPVFRHHEPHGSPDRQFTQLGAELIGAPSLWADGEILAMVSQGLKELGISRCRLVIGHAGIMPRLLEALGLSERVKMVIMGSMSALGKGASEIAQIRAHVSELGLLDSPLEGPKSLLATLDQEEARSLILWLLGEGREQPTGSRTPEEILGRFHARLQEADSPEQIEKGLTLAAELAAVKDTPQKAVEEGKRIIEAYGLPLTPLKDLAAICDLLKDCSWDSSQVVMDFGLARGLAYYTGIIFEVYHDLLPEKDTLCGGGRYDGLVRALGGPWEVPALGFAYGVERLKEALDAEGKNIPAQGSFRADVMVVAAGPPEAEKNEEKYGMAFSLAQSLRQKGHQVEIDVMERSTEESLRHAQTLGIPKVIVIEAEATKEYRLGKEGEYYATSGPPQ